jgi:hypothetical protein
MTAGPRAKNASWLRRLISASKYFLALRTGKATTAVVFAAAFYGIGMLVFLPSPEMVSIAALQTERIGFVAFDGRKAAFYEPGMRLAAGGEEPSQSCVRGLITPTNGSTVSYGRVAIGDIEIDVSAPPGAMSGAIAATLDYPPEERLPARRLKAPLILAFDDRCPSSPLRLPIWGSVTVGQEYRPQAVALPPEPTFLIAGEVKVWAKTALHIGGPPSLYPVSDLAVPVASRLEAWRDSATLAPVPVWWGIAYAGPDKAALEVDVSTEASELSLFRPNASEGEVIGVSRFTQLVSDPSILLLHIFAGAFLAIASLAARLATHLHDATKELKEARPTVRE